MVIRALQQRSAIIQKPLRRQADKTWHRQAGVAGQLHKRLALLRRNANFKARIVCHAPQFGGPTQIGNAPRNLMWPQQSAKVSKPNIFSGPQISGAVVWALIRSPRETRIFPPAGSRERIQDGQPRFTCDSVLAAIGRASHGQARVKGFLC
jgi:hypothetical protein